MNTKLEISFLQGKDFNEIVEAFQKIGWNKSRTIYENYLLEQKEEKRVVFVAKVNRQFAGYVTLKWHSDYLPFYHEGIPEIVDLNVLPVFRKQGIGTQLIKKCESLAFDHGYKKIGLGVGMTADYGQAQRLYFHLGYIPDGRGLHYKHQPINYASTVKVDDDLVLYFSKQLTNNKECY